MDPLKKAAAGLSWPAKVLLAVPATMLITALFIPELRMIELSKGTYVFGNFAKGQHLDKDGNRCRSGYECYERSHTTWRCGALKENNGPAAQFFNADYYNTQGVADSKAVDVCRTAVGFRWATAGLGNVAFLITAMILHNGIDIKDAAPNYWTWALIVVYLGQLVFVTVLLSMVHHATASKNIWSSDNPEIHWEYWVAWAVNFAAVLAALFVAIRGEFFNGSKPSYQPVTTTAVYGAPPSYGAPP